jgi:threonine synthase
MGSSQRKCSPAAVVGEIDFAGLGKEVAKLIVWDEGANRALNHKYWMAHQLIGALPSRYSEVVIGSCGNYGMALLLASRERGIRTTVFVPESIPEETLERLRNISPLIVREGRTYEHAVAASKRAAKAPVVADGNVDGPWGDALLEGIARRARKFITTCEVREPARIWVPTGNGTTVAGCWAAFGASGVNVELHAVSSAGNNSIMSTILGGGDRHVKNAPESIKESPDNLPLCNWNALHGAAAVEAILASSGSATEVSDEELRSASRHLAQLGVPATPAGAAGLAGLLRHGKADQYTDIVLVTSRSGASVGGSNVRGSQGGVGGFG